jgi:hypothetical protein
MKGWPEAVQAVDGTAGSAEGRGGIADDDNWLIREAA